MSPTRLLTCVFSKDVLQMLFNGASADGELFGDGRVVHAR